MPAPQSQPAGPAGRADRGSLAHKSFDALVVKMGDDGTGEFDLYAAVFSNIDRQDEVIAPGAFANLPEFAADGVGLVNHGLSALPVAWIESAVQDSKGLRVRGRFHSTPEAQACRTVVLERLAAHKSVKCSIGYRVDDYSLEKADGGRTITRIKSLRVYEFSFVNVPANPQAGVTAAKGAGRADHAVPTAEEPMSDAESKPTLIESVKEWLGLSTKKGRAISKANHAALSTFADAMAEHGEKSLEMCKGVTRALKDHGHSAVALAEEMREHLKSFGPAVDDDEADDDDDDAESEIDDDDAPKTKPKAKSLPIPTDAASRASLRARLNRLRPDR